MVVQSSPQYRARKLDEEMLNLMDTEVALTNILATTEKRLEKARSYAHPHSSARIVTFLQTIKTHVQQGLDAVYERRIDAFNRLSPLDMVSTRI